MKTFRLDRFLTLYFFHPLLKTKHNSCRKIPILMYHSISSDPEIAAPYYRVNTSPEVFGMHMQYLHENGYVTINFDDLPEYFHSQDNSKAVLITFDDGFKDFYSEAYPILAKYSFNATVFLPTSFIGGSFVEKKCLNWDEVRYLNACGTKFGSHTVSHPVLVSLPQLAIEEEVTHSKKKIQDELGEDISVFSYPYKLPENKSYLNTISSILKKGGYQYSVSTRIGTSNEQDDNFFMKRIPVNSGDDVSFFTAKLNAGYDWMYIVQKKYKQLRSII